MSISEATEYYFRDRRGRDITSLRGLFAWQAEYFYHVNPYAFHDYDHKLKEGDFVSDDLGKRIGPDVSQPVKCLETSISVQQRKEDGKIWISSNWLHHEDCYAATSPFADAITGAMDVVAGGDEMLYDSLWEKYVEICHANESEFERALEGYFGGEGLKGVYWNGGYVFAASKEWRIKTLEQLDEALEAEEGHFSSVLGEFIGWLRSNGLNLGDGAEEALRKRLRELYDAYPWGKARELGEYLVQEDRGEPSDVHLWWGGEPNSDSCYAYLTLFFEVDPEDIGTSILDEKVSRNLRAMINVAERERSMLSYYREYKPNIWKVFFS